MTVPTVEDRVLANGAMRRAFQKFLQRRSPSATAVAEFPEDLFNAFIKSETTIGSIAVEVEIAVAESRINETERCAKIAENFGNPDELLGKNVEATCKAIAILIRNQPR